MLDREKWIGARRKQRLDATVASTSARVDQRRVERLAAKDDKLVRVEPEIQENSDASHGALRVVPASRLD